ncbi:MAG: YitT family protein [Desulfobacterales bacterium]|nr:MAG: YitT family protein [Desulfobacterales bacterium]
MDLVNGKIATLKYLNGLHAVARSWKNAWESSGQVIWNLFLISLGSVICAVAVNGILIPQGFLSGGFVGISLIIHYLFPFLSVAVLYFILNVPVYILGWMYVGRRFFLYSVAGMLIFSVGVALIDVPIPVHDKLLSCILAGIISGVGGGVILKSLGSAGGMDILSIILFKRYSIRLGTSILVMNSLILAFTAYYFSLEGALYTLIYLYVSTQVLNVVVYGLSQRKAVYVISPQWEDIYHEIMEKIHRGVTLIGGRGGYTGQEIQMVFTVISFQELPRLKKLIQEIDRDAFVVVSDTLEVMGKGIGNQPHW